MKPLNFCPRAVIFDMDGLLIDSEPVWQVVEEAMLEARGKILEPEVRHRYVGMRMNDFWGGLQDAFALQDSVEALIAEAVGGMVARVGKEAAQRPGAPDLIGKMVFALYPHQTRYIVPASAVHVLPDVVPAARAVLAANLETAVNGIWDAGVQPGDRVTVIGAGAVGCLCAWIAGRIPGCVVELVDVNTTRASVASSLGVRFATPGSAEAGADVVLHASATPEGLALALNVAGFESRIVELSWYGDRAVPVPLGASFHSRRLRIASSQVGVVARSQRSRWDTRRRMALALSLLADESLDALITGESAFEDLPAIMPALAGPAGETICHRVRY